jgi:hypothetical protein
MKGRIMGHLRKALWSAAAAAAAVAAFGLAGSAWSFSDTEIADVFKMFDTQADGKITRMEFDVNRVRIVYRAVTTDPIAGVTFEQTKISRRFFDSIDSDRDGKLSPVEIYDGIRFENIASAGADSFSLDEFRRYMNSIGQ